MIGMHLIHAPSGTNGAVDAQTVAADGKALVRISDRWFFADDCQAR